MLFDPAPKETRKELFDRDRDLITCFRDPLSKDFFSVDKKEVEIVDVKTQYVLSMKR